MSYDTSLSIADQDDLMLQVSTFAQARGWTEDNYSTGTKKLSLHKGSCYSHFYWDDQGGDGGTYGTSIAMYQSLGYIGSGTSQWAHTTDSQNGKNSTDLAKGRGIKFIGDGPYTSLHLFGHTDPDVVYCILEFSPGLYRHFALGNIEKVGTWTGGEFVAGHHWEVSDSGLIDDPTSVYHSFLMDGRNRARAVSYPMALRATATMHIENMPNQNSENDHWGIVVDPLAVTDPIHTEGRDGNERSMIYGGCRDGRGVQQFGYLLPNLNAGYIPIIPIELFYFYDAGLSFDEYYLGKLGHCGHVSLNGISPQQVVIVGGDDWMAFPVVRKSYTVSNIQETRNMGMIYKK